MKVRVFVRLKQGVLDVQGKAVEHGVHNLGFKDVSGVRIGKLIEFDVEAKNADAAKEEAKAMCEKLLANPIIEDFEIHSI